MKKLSIFQFLTGSFQ